jgi:hypothetical protein
MVDTTALIAGMEVKYVVLGVLGILCAGVFAALYFSLKRNSNKPTLHYNVD